MYLAENLFWFFPPLYVYIIPVYNKNIQATLHYLLNLIYTAVCAPAAAADILYNLIFEADERLLTESNVFK